MVTLHAALSRGTVVSDQAYFHKLFLFLVVFIKQNFAPLVKEFYPKFSKIEIPMT